MIVLKAFFKLLRVSLILAKIRCITAVKMQYLEQVLKLNSNEADWVITILFGVIGMHQF